MLDNFREEIVVQRNRGLSSFLYSLCWMGIILFGFVGFAFVQIFSISFIFQKNHAFHFLLCPFF